MKKITQHTLWMTFSFLMIGLMASCEDPVVDPPAQTISSEEANRLEETYKATRAEILKDTLGFEDTREFWFSLDTLKKYITYVEQEGAKQGRTNLGLRVYLGVYPENGNYPTPGYSTVFFVPTAEEGANPLKQGFAPIQQDQENLDGVAPLNYGNGGIPPNDYDDD